MTAKHVLLEKDLLENAAALKRFGYFPLGKELKKQTIVAEKLYQKLESNKKEERIRKCCAMFWGMCQGQYKAGPTNTLKYLSEKSLC